MGMRVGQRIGAYDITGSNCNPGGRRINKSAGSALQAEEVGEFHEELVGIIG